MSEVPVGKAAVIRSVRSGAAGQGLRLEELGFLASTRVRVERRAPLGGSTIYDLRGSRMALRREDAELIDAEVIE